jgi:hypothetical protein
MNDEKPQLRSFLDKCRIAKSAQSKEIRLTIQEAEQLGFAIGMLLAKELELAEQVIGLQSQILSAEVQQDGGGF